jgi:hypothetical protein
MRAARTLTTERPTDRAAVAALPIQNLAASRLRNTQRTGGPSRSAARVRARQSTRPITGREDGYESSCSSDGTDTCGLDRGGRSSRRRTLLRRRPSHLEPRRILFRRIRFVSQRRLLPRPLWRIWPTQVMVPDLKPPKLPPPGASGKGRSFRFAGRLCASRRHMGG